MQNQRNLKREQVDAYLSVHKQDPLKDTENFWLLDESRQLTVLAAFSFAWRRKEDTKTR